MGASYSSLLEDLKFARNKPYYHEISKEELCVFGYMRTRTETNKIVPDEIMKICLKYYVKFNLHDTWNIGISSPDFQFKGERYKILSMKNPSYHQNGFGDRIIKRYEKYVWLLKFHVKYASKSRLDGFEDIFVGVIQNSELKRHSAKRVHQSSGYGLYTTSLRSLLKLVYDADNGQWIAEYDTILIVLDMIPSNERSKYGKLDFFGINNRGRKNMPPKKHVKFIPGIDLNEEYRLMVSCGSKYPIYKQQVEILDDILTHL